MRYFGLVFFLGSFAFSADMVTSIIERNIFGLKNVDIPKKVKKSEKSVSPKSWNIVGVIVKGGERLVLVKTGKEVSLMKEGEKLRGYTIESVEKDRVLLKSQEGVILEVKLYDTEGLKE